MPFSLTNSATTVYNTTLGWWHKDGSIMGGSNMAGTWQPKMAHFGDFKQIVTTEDILSNPQSECRMFYWFLELLLFPN